MAENVNIWDLFDLKDKVFLVAGGARDFGKQLATALAEAHADGVITSRFSERAEATAKEISDLTERRIVGMQLDATDDSQVESVVAETIKKFGRIDVLVNCVGGGAAVRKDEPMNFEDRQINDWHRLQNLNVTSVFLLCKHVSRVMEKQKSGSIINITSIAGMIGRDRSVYVDGMIPQTIDYAAAKASVIGMTRDLAAYLGSGYGIRVNAISPGGFERRQHEGFIEGYSKKCILGKMGRDGVDLKGAVVYLASDASAYVTGHNLVVDGGFTAWQ